MRFLLDVNAGDVAALLQEAGHDVDFVSRVDLQMSDDVIAMQRKIGIRRNLTAAKDQK